MMAKRILSALLTLLMLASVFVSVPFTSAAEAPVVITDTNPAIPADVGQKIDLSGYTVQGMSSTLTWSLEGETVKTFTPDKKGVTALTVSDGEATKNIYVVAKNADEEEYVLYENDFSGTLDDLKADGWVFPYMTHPPTVSGGVLHLGNKNADTIRAAILPAWLGDFGDYAITINSNLTDTTDASRWSSIAYRIQNENNKYTPFYQFCFRANTGSSTFEHAEWLIAPQGNGWNVCIAQSGSINMTVANKYHTMTVKAFGNTVEYCANGDSVVFIDDVHTVSGSNTAKLQLEKGLIGLNSDNGVMNVDSIRVTLQLEAPEKPPVVPELIDSSANRTETNIANYFSNQAYATVDNVDTILNADAYPVAVLLDVTGKTLSQADYASYLNKFAERNIIPQFKMDSTAQVDLLIKALDETKVPEALVASADAAVVKYAREKSKTVIRGAYDISGLDTTRLSAEELYNYYNKATGAYAQAIILPYALATKANVAELQEYELAVWAFGTGIDTDSEAAWLIASGANAVITDSWKKVDETQAKLFTAQNSITKTPVWTGHRGYPKKYAENSVSGCLGAIEDGADCVEIDVKLSSDGHVVVMHDNTIDRTTNGTGNIMQMTLEKIKTFKLKHNGKITDESIPTFEEILQTLQGKDIKILCEFKSTQAKLAEKCAALIKKYDMEDQVVFICFTPSMLTSIKKYMNTSTGYLLNAPAYVDNNDTVGTLNAYKSLQTSTLSYHATMAVNYGNITSEFLRDANDRGLTLWSWTYGQSDTTNISKMFLAGMNGMTTDNVGNMKNTLKSIYAPTKVYVAPNGTAAYTAYSETYGGTVTDISKTAKVIAIENDGVIEISGGKITAKKNGVATFMVSYESKLPNSTKYTLYSQPITVVVGDIPELTLNDDKFKVENGVLYGATPKLTVKDLLSKIVNASDVKVYDASGKLVTDENALVGNGFVLSYRDIDTTVQLRGDIDGNGKLESKDYLMLKRAILGTFELSDVQKLASDADGNGKGETKDYLMLKRHILGTFDIYK